MKYKLVKTDLWLRDKLIPEGTTLELSQADAEPLSQYLVEVIPQSQSTSSPKGEKKPKTNKPINKSAVAEKGNTNEN